MTATPAVAPPRGAQGTLRRIIVFAVLFVLVIVTVNGLAGLLLRLFEVGTDTFGDAGGLAFSLAFTLIGGPLALILWWFAWRRLDGADRASVAWGLYLGAMLTVTLIGATTSLLGAASDAIAGTWPRNGLAYGIAWAVAWVAHRFMQGSATRSPLRLATVPVVLGAAYGLVVAAAGLVRMLETLFDAAFVPGGPSVGTPWWVPALQSLVWAAGGALVCWWHWIRDRGRDVRGGFADVVLVVLVALAAAAGLGGIARALYVGLRAAVDAGDGWAKVLDPLPLALAGAGIGMLVWLWLRRITAERGGTAATAARLSEAGLGLVGAASGVGVIINALLASFTTSLAGGDARPLLLGGLATLAVGIPVWWFAWRPAHTSAERGTPARRVYLVVVFGVSAVVAIVALIMVGYRIFEVLLDGAGEGFIERIRAPFGLLCATALVSAYHFAVWRGEREVNPAVTRRIDRITLVAGGDTTALAAAVKSATGAAVAVLPRADAAIAAGSDAVVAALDGVVAHRVLVIADADSRIQVIPLAD